MGPAPADLMSRLLALVSEPGFAPARKRSLARRLEVPEADYRAFRHWIDELVESGRLAELRHGKYGLPPAGAKRKGTKAARRAAPQHPVPVLSEEDEPSVSPELLRGLPRAARLGRVELKRGGYGFLVSDPPGRDLFLAAADLNGALHGDLAAVLPRRGDRGGRTAGRVIRILRRAHPFIVGTFYNDGEGARVAPDTRGLFQDVEVPGDAAGDARDGDKVAVELLEPDLRRRGAPTLRGRVAEVYGAAGEARAELAAIVRNFELRAEFPPETLAAAQALPEEPSPEELAGRVDYTSPAAFTIDPEDAKDHDDAVAIRDGKDGGTQALVHIADVSFYVAEGSPVDLEARRRATSVYLPGLTFPMLPPRLSSDLCSLREGALRLTKTIALTFSRNARLVETRIERSYIRSAAFLTYEQVKQAVEEERPGPARSPEVYGALQRMRAFTQELRRRRLQAGALDLDLPETRLLLDEHGAVAGWEKQGHHWAHQLIEELMLAANRAVAEELAARGLPGMFRVHEEPDPKALRQFAEFVSEFGLTLRPPYDRVKLQRLLEKVRGRDHEEAVNFALLTSLKQARYSAECRPHYALAFTRYLHFTSPIRRYPDLVVHRALDGAFGPGAKSLPAERAQRSGGDDYYRQVARLRSLSDHCSRRERESDAAEEEAVKVRQLAFLRRNLRDCHEGVITRVREFGFFVELRDCRVEGLVRIQDLRDDHYEYLPQLHLLQGRRRGRTFRLGDKVQVRVLYVDQGRRQVGLGII